jgi:hypothetical protein
MREIVTISIESSGIGYDILEEFMTVTKSIYCQSTSYISHNMNCGNIPH